MGLREALGTLAMGVTRSFWRATGLELAVKVSDHSIELEMVDPGNTTEVAWDPHLYKNGNLFRQGYANPIKPIVNHSNELSQSDTVSGQVSLRGSVTEPKDLVSDGGEEASASESEEGNPNTPHAAIISSGRYRQYMHQDLISQILNPREQWRLIVFAVLALAGLMLINVLISLQISGAF